MSRYHGSPFLDDNKTNDDGDGNESGKKYVYCNRQQL